jgi:hypothetical protein
MADENDRRSEDRLAENGPNRTDPIPALGGVTQEQLHLQKNPLTLDNESEALHSAVQAGDEQLVRTHLSAVGNRELSGEEVAALAAVHREAEENAYDAKKEQDDKAEAQEEKREKRERWIELEEARTSGAADSGSDKYDVDAYGGYVNEKDGFYYDSFGGHYDDMGYTFKDGSYTSLTGMHLDAKTGTITERDGTVRECPMDCKTDEQKRALAHMNGQVVAMGHGRHPHHAGDMTDTAKADAARSEGGGLDAMEHLSQGTDREWAMTRHIHDVRKEKGLSDKAPVTQREYDESADWIERHREYVQKGKAKLSADLADPGTSRFTALSEAEAVKNIHTIHTPDLVDGKTAAAPSGSSDDKWYADKRGGIFDDEGGYYDTRGGYWSGKGEYYDPKGGYWDTKNNHVDKDGNLTAADGKYYKAQDGIDFRAQLIAAVDTGKDWAPPPGVRPSDPAVMTAQNSMFAPSLGVTSPVAQEAPVAAAPADSQKRQAAFSPPKLG